MDDKPDELHAFSAYLNQEGIPDMDREGNRHASGKAFDLHVLLVEDNPLNQKVVGRLLEKLGCTYVLALNGRDALSKLEEHEFFDIVLMDLAMPEMNGIEATKAIRASQGHYSNIPIIAHTAMHTEREASMEAGMNDFLAKPVTLAKIVEVLTRCKSRIH